MDLTMGEKIAAFCRELQDTTIEGTARANGAGEVFDRVKAAVLAGQGAPRPRPISTGSTRRFGRVRVGSSDSIRAEIASTDHSAVPHQAPERCGGLVLQDCARDVAGSGPLRIRPSAALWELHWSHNRWRDERVP